MLPVGLTYSGHALACAAGVANIKFMQENKIISVFDVFGRPVSSSSSNDLTITIYSDGSVKKSIVNF